jgi:hypothetical protein
LTLKNVFELENLFLTLKKCFLTLRNVYLRSGWDPEGVDLDLLDGGGLTQNLGQRHLANLIQLLCKTEQA